MKLSIDRLAYGGYGVGRADGKVYFVPYGLPGDVLDVAVYRDQKRFAYASIEKIIEPSPDRIEAKCPIFQTCGGCNWQNLPYEKQLFWKEEILKETLERIGKLDVANKISPIIPSPNQWNYRNRIQLHVNRDGKIGFYKTHGQEIVDVERCDIADERINDALKDMDKRKIRQLGWDVEFIHDAETDEVSAEGGKGSFSQVNTEQNKVLIETVLKFLDVGATPSGRPNLGRHGDLPLHILELFAGSGNFSFPLAAAGAHVTAIDQMPPTKIPALNEVPKGSVNFMTMKVEKAFKELEKKKLSFDAVLMDPPRKGARFALEGIVKQNPNKIVYVSCFPPTLARDLQYLTQHGFELEKIQPVDMFPQTYHIESIALLRKA